MLESVYQAQLIKRLQEMFPGCVVIKNDPRQVQGIPDLIVLYGNRWAALEAKASPSARIRPNQDYYVEMLNDMSFAAFIHPGNEEGVLRALQLAFRA